MSERSETTTTYVYVKIPRAAYDRCKDSVTAPDALGAMVLAMPVDAIEFAAVLPLLRAQRFYACTCHRECGACEERRLLMASLTDEQRAAVEASP